MEINTSDWVIQEALIYDTWVNSPSGHKIKVINPANGALIGTVPDLAVEEVAFAIDAAQKALRSWKQTSAVVRSQLLRRWFDLMVENKKNLGALLALEQGKPLKEAIGEIQYGASFVEWFAEEAKRIYGDTIPSTSGNRITVIKQPVGVVAAITPWNFPNAMITRKAAPALAAGCTIVIKPSEETPFSALAMAKLALEAGIPPGVINVVTTTDAKGVGELFCESDIVRKISFTGSTAVGKLLMKQAATTVKKISLELGGNAPFIVFDDADLPKAVEGLIASKFRNAGQTCVSANRVFVHKPIIESFSKLLAAKIKTLKVGEAFVPEVTIGPLINTKALEKVKSTLEQAINEGAQVVSGGKEIQCVGNFFEPTIIQVQNHDNSICQQEIFGPVVTLIPFETEEEVIQWANDTNAGLASYFYSENMKRIVSVSEGLEYGMVGVNTGMISTAVAPFGGMKESGLGREGSKYGIEDYLEIKYINMAID